MPIGRVPRIARMIENGDSELLALHVAGHVDPIRPFSPAVLFSLLSVGVYHPAGSFRELRRFRTGRFETSGDTHPEGALFRIAERHLFYRSQHDIAIDNAQLGIRV